MITITLTDGTFKDVPRGSTFLEISDIFAIKDVVAVKTKDNIISLSEQVKNNITIEFITSNSFYGVGIYRAGLKLLFQVALKRVIKDAEVSYEHSVPGGVLCLINNGEQINREDVVKIKEVMDELVKQNKKIRKLNIRKREAIEYYKENKEQEKAKNVSSITDKVVALYELEGVYNYFYSDMPNSTGLLKSFDLEYLGENKIILVMPDKQNLVPEYTHHKDIIKTFYDSKKWLEALSMSYVMNLNETVGNTEIKTFMKSSELMFDINISKLADRIDKEKKYRFIMIAGPSSSGKTTTTKRLSEYLRTKGYDPIPISSDDYFIDRDKLIKDENGELDFENIEAIDLKYLNNDIHKLLRGESIIPPTYNFISGKKTLNNKPIKLEENSILLIEGLHSLNDRLLPNINKDEVFKIYLSPFIPLNIDKHNYVSTLDLRLIRRMVRDNLTRGYGVDRTMHAWQKVRAGEEKWIFPFINEANVIINTALVYELGVLKVFAEPLLLNIDVDSEYYLEAKRLLNFLKPFFSIPGEYVDKDSILREFIGG